MGSVETAGFTTDMANLAQSVGRRLGPAEWIEMTQELVDQFADLTGDHHFIHVDPERAKQTPFGGTIAHGFLSLSLLGPVLQLLKVSDAGTAINYGLNKLRFPAPLKVGDRCRGFAEIVSVSEVRGGGMEVALKGTIEVEDSDRPAVVAECLLRFYA
jgi:acyl dehydratase